MSVDSASRIVYVEPLGCEQPVSLADNGCYLACDQGLPTYEYSILLMSHLQFSFSHPRRNLSILHHSVLSVGDNACQLAP